MKSITYKEILAFSLFLALAGALAVVFQHPRLTAGSVELGSQYQSVVIPVTADLSNLCPPRGTAESSTGVLGSVNITRGSVAELVIVDATTSNATLRATVATSSLTLVHFPIMATSSNHFDLEFKRGLLIDTIGTVGSTTITYRCEG